MQCYQDSDDPSTEKCPAMVAYEMNEVNHGVNGGRFCWKVAGSFCEGILKAKNADKEVSCMGCDFFSKVLREEEDFRFE